MSARTYGVARTRRVLRELEALGAAVRRSGVWSPPAAVLAAVLLVLVAAAPANACPWTAVVDETGAFVITFDPAAPWEPACELPEIAIDPNPPMTVGTVTWNESRDTLRDRLANPSRWTIHEVGGRRYDGQNMEIYLMAVKRRNDRKPVRRYYTASRPVVDGPLHLRRSSWRALG